MTQIRRLTDKGRAEFKAWLEGGAKGEPPRHLLTGADTSDEIAGSAHVAPRTFATRLELGHYLVKQLSVLTAASVAFDEGLWDWLSLFYIDELLPPDSGGRRDAKELVRYALELRNRKWSRHVLRVSWMAVREHGAAARVMLAVPLTKHTDVIEQIGGQQEAFGATCVVELADRLYWDAANDRLKRGAQGKAGGSPRRLVRFLRQFRRTYDPPAMTAQQLRESLPREFERWLKAPRKDVGAAADAALATGSPG